MKISVERLLAESSKLQDHRHQNCVICNATVESVGSSGHHVKTNVDRSEQSSLIPECTDWSDDGAARQRRHLLTSVATCWLLELGNPCADRRTDRLARL